MRAAARASSSAGDLFFLSYSGHGGQVPDINGEEADSKDETWCLYDGQLIDDELYFELSRFAAGCEFWSCPTAATAARVTRELPPPAPPAATARQADARRRRRCATYALHKAFYDKLQARRRRRRRGKAYVDPDAALAQVGSRAAATDLVGKFNPAVVLISGCQDNQTSMDGEHNGAFTEQLLKVWNQGAFRGQLRAASMPASAPACRPTQSPNLFVLGSAGSFLAQQPFAV